MNIYDIMWTALATTCGTAIVLLAHHFWRQRRNAKLDELERSRLAQYLAIRVTCVLDRFIFECSEVVADGGEYVEGELHATVDHPKLSLPDDVDWRSIPPSLAYSLLSLPNALDSAGRSIDYKTHVATRPGYEEHFAEVRYQFSKLGLTALDLVGSIRKEHVLPAMEMGNGWDPRRTFQIHVGERDGMAIQGPEAVRNVIIRTKEKAQT